MLTVLHVARHWLGSSVSCGTATGGVPATASASAAVAAVERWLAEGHTFVLGAARGGGGQGAVVQLLLLLLGQRRVPLMVCRRAWHGHWHLGTVLVDLILVLVLILILVEI